MVLVFELLTCDFNSDLRRYVFTRDDHVKYTDKAGVENMARVDHIFIHELDDKRFIFAVLTPLTILDEKDDILGLQKVVHDVDNPILVGINAILPAQPYIVPIDDNTTVWVEWQVEWL